MVVGKPGDAMQQGATGGARGLDQEDDLWDSCHISLSIAEESGFRLPAKSASLWGREEWDTVERVLTGNRAAVHPVLIGGLHRGA